MSDGIIDQTVFDDLKDTAGADFAAELVETFLEEAPGMIAELRAAAEGGDADAFRRAAHSLKSNANVFGASNLAEKARDLELSGLDKAADVDALVATYDKSASALKALIDG